MSRTFVLPDLGEGIHEAQIIRVMIKPGDAVDEDQPLMEVETDKAAVEIPSPYGGKVEKVHVKEGQTISVGDTIVTYSGADGEGAAERKKGEKAAPTDEQAEEGEEAAKDKKPKAAAKPKAAKPKDRKEDKEGAEAEDKEAEEKEEEEEGAEREEAEAKGEEKEADEDEEGAEAEAEAAEKERARAAAPRAAAPSPGARAKVSAAPAVRKMARDLGLDLETVEGSGPGGRITREDLERHAAAAAAPKRAAPAGAAVPKASAAPAPAATTVAPMPTQPPPGEVGKDKWGTIRTWPLSQIRKTIANQMKTAAFTIPHVTHGDEADVTDMEQARKRLNDATGGNPKLTVMAMVMRAVCVALRKFPIFNAVFDGENNAIIYKDYINLGVAVDTDRGLIVPNVRNADRLSVIGLAQALQTIADNARTGQFAIDDLRGGTYTITNVGPLGGTFATPIINHPEVAILGLGRTRKVPVFDENDNVKPALIMPVFVSFDHRAADGLAAAKFTREIVGLLEQPELMLLY